MKRPTWAASPNFSPVYSHLERLFAESRRIVDNEDKKKPFSDETLADLLAKDQGVKIARRTVTKYRRALDIPSSSRRRDY